MDKNDFHFFETSLVHETVQFRNRLLDDFPDVGMRFMGDLQATSGLRSIARACERLRDRLELLDGTIKERKRASELATLFTALADTNPQDFPGRFDHF